MRTRASYTFFTMGAITGYEYGVYPVGQRIELTKGLTVVGGDGRVPLGGGTMATVSMIMDDHLRAWTDGPVYEVPLRLDEFAAHDEVWSDEQWLVLQELKAGPLTTTEIDALLRAAGEVPKKRLPVYWDRRLMYVLSRMSLVQSDYDYVGYPREQRYLITDRGRRVVRGHETLPPLGPRQRLSALAG